MSPTTIRPERALAAVHAYPEDLARLVRQRWGEEARDVAPSDPILLRLLSVCYQASLLREEGRPITFRIALAEPELFDSVEGPPAELHRLVLTRPRPFDEHELRRLAPAATFERALIGLRAANDDLELWGLVHSGPRWLQAVRGGRHIEQTIPEVLMAAVTGPGRVLVSKGTRTLAALANGTLIDFAIDVFSAPWLASWFGGVRDSARVEEDAGRGAAHDTLDPSFGPQLAQHVLRRIVSTVRAARHGGTLVFLRAERAQAIVDAHDCLTLKYEFRDEEPRRRIASLVARIEAELARVHARSSGAASQARVGWAEYETSTEARLADLDEALFEAAHLVATLADVDGAVVMTERFEILGFGAEIAAALADVESVDRSLDLEGTRRIGERTDRVGTRHRSAYRLSNHLRDALSVVVSQDGGVRFVCVRDDRVTYFDQVATGPWEV